MATYSAGRLAPIVDRAVSKGECSGRLEGAFCSVPWDVEAAICKRPGRCRRGMAKARRGALAAAG